MLRHERGVGIQLAIDHPVALRGAALHGEVPVTAVVVVPGARAVVEHGIELLRVLRNGHRHAPHAVGRDPLHRHVGQHGLPLVDAVVQIDAAGALQRTARRVVGDGHALAGLDRARTHRDHLATTAATTAAGRAFTDPDVHDRASRDIATRIDRLDVVVQERAANARDVRVHAVRDPLRHLEEVDATEVVDVLRREGRRRHRYRGPRTDLGPAREGLVLRARQRVGAVHVLAPLQRDRLQAADVVHEAPHREVAVIGVLRVAVRTAVVHAAGVPRPALRVPDRRGRRLGGSGAHDGGRVLKGLVAGDRGLDFHVERGAVIHVAGVQRAEEEVPGAFGRRGRTAWIEDLRGAHRAARGGAQVIGRADPVLCRGDDGPVADVFRPTVDDVDLALRVDRRPVPVEELRRTEVALGVDPCAVLHVHEIRGRHGVRIEVLLDHAGHEARTHGLAHEVRHRLGVVGVPAAPCVVAVMGEHHEHRARRIVRGRQLLQPLHAQRRVAVLPAQALAARHDDDRTRRAGFGVHPLRAMREVGPRQRLGRAAAPADRDAIERRRGTVDLVGLVGWIAVHPARSELHREVGIGARDLLTAHERPLDSLLLQDRDQALAEGHLAGEEALADAGVRAPHARVGLLVEADVHAHRIVIAQRQERMVIRELHDVHARPRRRTGVGERVAGLSPRIDPERAVPELPTRLGERLDVGDEPTAEADLRAALGGPGDRVHGVARAVLVGRHSVIEPEDRTKVVRGIRCAPVAAQDRLPGTLVTVRSARLLVGPVDRLLKVPQVGEVHAFGHHRGADERSPGERGGAEHGGRSAWHDRRVDHGSHDANPHFAQPARRPDMPLTPDADKTTCPDPDHSAADTGRCGSATRTSGRWARRPMSWRSS